MRQKNFFRCSGCPRPLSFLHAKLENQRGARLGVRFLLQHDKNCGRGFHGTAETKPDLKRNVANNLRRSVTEIESNQAEAAALYQQIGRAKSLVNIAAAHPE